MIKTVELNILGLEQRTQQPKKFQKLRGVSESTGVPQDKSIQHSVVFSQHDALVMQTASKMGGDYMESGSLRIPGTTDKSITNADTNNQSDEDSASTQSSVTFTTYPCWICPGVVPVQLQMGKQVYLPHQQIDVIVRMNDMQSKIKDLRISLHLDLTILSVVTGSVLEQRTEELGCEHYSREQILECLQDQTFFTAKLSLSEINNRNLAIVGELLNEYVEYANSFEIHERSLTDAGRILQAQSPEELSHVYCQLATCNAEAIKSQFSVKVEFSISTSGLMKQQSRKITMPIEILQPQQTAKQHSQSLEYP